MELAFAPLSPYYVVSPVANTSRNFSPSLPNFATIPRISGPSLASRSSGFVLRCEKVKLRSSFMAAGLGNTTTDSTDVSGQEFMSLTTQPNPETKDGAVKENDSEHIDDQKMIRICDKLIRVFMVDKPTPTDWRRLLTFSKEWDNIGPHFYKRCEDRADSESDPGTKHKLLRLSRKLKEIDVDLQRQNELLNTIRKSPSEVGEIVARRRKDFTKEFFVHLHTVAESYYDNPTEQNAIAKLGNICLAAVESYDTATESLEALNAAELKFQDIINSPSIDAACRKIDNLAEKNQLDSALVLMITKAWSAAKESNMMKDEAKDVLYHLYKTASGNLQRLVPKEIRILKYLLTIEDPEERMSALNDAFTPGDELEGMDVDCLYTTPEQLHTWIRSVVDAYHFSREGTLIKEAKDLMSPTIIKKLEVLKKMIQDNFM
ncbi:hypothetical protein CASFOL_015736 [Castilleja foliolosa]|uniref:Uncharacterized protein n=1 Tax=Castilleja foliolosa TaxID=1961234 RepID=A0ABD3DEI4_9LAMI